MKGLRRILFVLLGLAVTLCPAFGAMAADESADPVILLVTPAAGQDSDASPLEEPLRGAFPGYEIRRADAGPESLGEAMERLAGAGVREVVALPALVTDGGEYAALAEEISRYARSFDSLRIAGPLLRSNEDYKALVSALTTELKSYDKNNAAFLLLGREAGPESGEAYGRLGKMFAAAGHDNWFVCSPEDGLSPEAVLARLRESGARKVILLPLGLGPGDGEEPWRSALTAQGCKVVGLSDGLGHYAPVQALAAARVERAMAGPKPVILAVSAGTADADSREMSIGGLENGLRRAFPDHEIRRAFTNGGVIAELKERNGEYIDTVAEAMERLLAEDVREVIVQPAFLTEGAEYDAVAAEVSRYADRFDSLKMGRALLRTGLDYEDLLSTLTEELRPYTGNTAVVLADYGSGEEDGELVARLRRALAGLGYERWLVAGPAGGSSPEDILAWLRERGEKSVTLLPLRIEAPDGEDPWRSALESGGHKVVCVPCGLGRTKGLQDLMARHALEALPLTPAAGETSASADRAAAEGPAFGSYEIRVVSGSSAFRVEKARLMVDSEGMSCAMTVSGQDCGRLFLGSSSDALIAPEEECIPFELDAAGEKTFLVPVEALDTDIRCAAWSVKNQRWYDRVLVFASAGLSPAAPTA